MYIVLRPLPAARGPLSIARYPVIRCPLPTPPFPCIVSCFVIVVTRCFLLFGSRLFKFCHLMSCPPRTVCWRERHLGPERSARLFLAHTNIYFDQIRFPEWCVSVCVPLSCFTGCRYAIAIAPQSTRQCVRVPHACVGARMSHTARHFGGDWTSTVVLHQWNSSIQLVTKVPKSRRRRRVFVAALFHIFSSCSCSFRLYWVGSPPYPKQGSPFLNPLVLVRSTPRHFRHPPPHSFSLCKL